MTHSRRGKLVVRRKGYHRRGYTRKGGIEVSPAYVPPTTYEIKDIGTKGRGKKVVVIKRKGALKNLGYSTGASTTQRHRALMKAFRKYGKPTVFRMLQAQVVLRKRTQPHARKVFEADRNWVEKQMSRRQRLEMTEKPRMKWISMTPRQRALAMPERKWGDIIHNRKKPLYRVETGTGYYAYVFGRNRALQLSKNLKKGDVFEIPKSKKVFIKQIKKPTKMQELEARINEILSTGYSK